MSTKHTPGPWTVHSPSYMKPSHVNVSACDGQVDIYEAPLTIETMVNARLIAAAPDLLEALEKSYEWIKQAVDDYGGCDHEVGICACSDIRFLGEIETLVAKAKGESHE